MIKIIRLEDNNGKGIYRNGFYWDIAELTNWEYYTPDFRNVFCSHDRHYIVSSMIRQPSPTDNLTKKQFIRKYHIFGFISVKQLRDWFTDTELFLLSKMSVYLTEYELKSKNNIVVDDQQVMFDKRKAKIVSKIPLTEYISNTCLNVNHVLIKESLFYVKQNNIKMDTENGKLLLDMFDMISPITGMKEPVF